MLSPNYWDNNSVGNKHWFFVLEGIKNDKPTRGIYNEFLSAELEIIKSIIATNIKENEIARNKAAALSEKNKLIEILDSKQDKELKGMTKEQILARINDLEKAS